MGNEFGRMLRDYRLQSVDPDTDKPLTQKRVAELVGKWANIFIDPTTEFYWEKGKYAPRKDNRRVVVGLVSVFREYSKLESLEKANAFLAAGGYAPLRAEEISEIRGREPNPWSAIAKSGSRKVAGEKNEAIEQEDKPELPSHPPRPGSAPRPPSLIVGREEDMHELRTRLTEVAHAGSGKPQVLTSQGAATEKHTGTLAAVRGWPGVGKTTIAAALAYDKELKSAFPDGVLWVSLGQQPNVLSELATWGRALGLDLSRVASAEEASGQLAAFVRNKRMFLIVDDVWDALAARPFLFGGPGSTTLLTTRENDIALALSRTPDDVYRLNVLTDQKAMELLTALAPSVVKKHPDKSLELVQELEGLPLALQVAGRWLHSEESKGFSVSDLLTELRAGAKLLQAKAPSDLAGVEKETIPTVAALLQKSTERLDPLTRDCFAYMGPFAPKPATFDLAALKAVWEIENPKPIVRTLVGRGLLEAVPESGRYQMHSLLVMHAKSLLTDD